MKPTTWMYIGAVILFLMAACGLGGGAFIWLGSTAGHPEWNTLIATLILAGVLTLVGGVVVIVLAVRKTKQETAQNVTIKVDLPGETKVEQMKCKSCGGALTTDNIKMVNGAPVVTCPYCNTVYQLTEEPKW
jgi:hypothetical protein